MPLTYAIGDIHGRLDLLEALLSAIGDDAGGRQARILFLGDIIDRGPDSRRCLDRVLATLDELPGSRLILGNHEEFLLNFVDRPTERAAIASRWLVNGGVATLQSYGLDDGDGLDSLAAQLAEKAPAHLAGLRTADWMIETGSHVFVHAGIDPDLPLSGQQPETTRWIRDRFLGFTGPLAKIVVHGHTITASSRPEIHHNRIAIDTGAVHSGRLTCAVFDQTAPPRFLATSDDDGAIEVGEIRPLQGHGRA
ncbi:metallophosphoesterase family protein [Hoeflea sp. YIM 152468]|uniref:metallophosphoesterase family protein n=1 Tax=Hoeflea sp. YIM 152468 TaxID=3031759 RepID=UPI0023DA0301|nr:metallophosphoesterase family protein [Hoeflea sp. YIM 152468]MDF1607535.1 metallophosphoesterase family protein [Hoeflea sp. YIM 152468]